ncbi:methionine gamma-lyase [Pseudoalteromonas sp. CNC9-20]|uniref:methionine gamma-lyase n=1 Tax=Pseudoalteromonas sp. CNC9-20 TaxID=2917750 RepID=UPI001EF4BA18|nr:methionine gamma-lyase [Pseudoalteromonas sp. CNC9-20]MCG7571217.1 methionine gamma-lyase [Pseudoalteromonas sp. CNC9-20]
MKNIQPSDKTQCIHPQGERRDPHRALAAPLYQTSTFVFDDAAQGAARFAGEEGGYIYSRLGNPTVRELEQKLAALEQTEDAAACATGMGAVSAAVMSFLSAGDHLIASTTVYGCTYALFSHLLTRFGVEVTFVDCNDIQAVKQALRPNTKMLFVETPANPNIDVYDLQQLCDVAKSHQLISVVDNTFLTPILQKPAHFGADLIVHSATKYLNGHGDVVAGLVCGSNEHIQCIKSTVLKDIGATMSPFDAWLILRGMKTLAVRMQAHCQSAHQVAEFLNQHQSVERVYFPGLKNDPGHRLMGSQMQDAGGVIAFELKASLAQTEQFINSLQLCTLAVSLGDTETLIQHPASMTHSTYEPEQRRAAGISDGLVRISIGLEDVNEIIADLSQGLAKL